MLGLTKRQLSEMIGVTYQQIHKYETRVNRISAGRLYHIAEVLSVHIDYFFEGLDGSERAFVMPQQQRLLFELTRAFIGIADIRQQRALCALARVLATTEK